MSKRLIQDLHAGISRRDWSAVETAANRLRDDIEETSHILAGIAIGSLPNDYPLAKLASDALHSETASVREGMQDKIEGLEADLDSAVSVAYGRGATEWVRLNYPAHYERLASPTDAQTVKGGE